MGRELAEVTANSKTIAYKYNKDGIRQSKTVNGTTTTFTLVDNKITGQDDGTNKLYFRYDSNDSLIGFEKTTNNTTTDYYYVKNLQGDIISILDSDGNDVVDYIYDAWGKLLSTTDTSNDNIGSLNPFRYRSYYFDTETKLYYLQSRYYDPNTGRFINADDVNVLQNLQGEVLDANLFNYCGNNAINLVDYSGKEYATYYDLYMNTHYFFLDLFNPPKFEIELNKDYMKDKFVITLYGIERKFLCREKKNGVIWEKYSSRYNFFMAFGFKCFKEIRTTKVTMNAVSKKIMIGVFTSTIEEVAKGITKTYIKEIDKFLSGSIDNYTKYPGKWKIYTTTAKIDENYSVITADYYYKSSKSKSFKKYCSCFWATVKSRNLVGSTDINVVYY